MWLVREKEVTRIACKFSVKRTRWMVLSSVEIKTGKGVFYRKKMKSPVWPVPSQRAQCVRHTAEGVG